MLRPVGLHPLDRYDDDLITIQKYQGKTNEQFTKLLLNVTLLSSSFAAEMLTRKLTVLDPLCGRGTTLNQALMYGFDAAGVDLDQKDFAAYRAFLQTWLQRKRLKHHVSYDGPVRRNGKVVARRLQVSMAPGRDAWKTGATQLLDVVNADTAAAAEFFRPASARRDRHGRAVRGAARQPVGDGRPGPRPAGAAPAGGAGLGGGAATRRRDRDRVEHAGRPAGGRGRGSSRRPALSR